MRGPQVSKAARGCPGQCSSESICCPLHEVAHEHPACFDVFERWTWASTQHDIESYKLQRKGSAGERHVCKFLPLLVASCESGGHVVGQGFCFRHLHVCAHS